MTRFEVIESKHWVRDDGRTASLYGAVPWVSPSEEKRWKVVTRGYTVRDNERGTVGIGRQPWATRAEAQAWVDKETARLEEARRWHEANYPKKTSVARGKRTHATKKSPAQLQREIDEALAKPVTASKETAVLRPTSVTNLDRILDRVTPRHEITIDADDFTRAQVERVRDAAKARGLHVSGTARWILIRHPPRHST